MVYSEELAMRVRGALAERDDVIEKKMFGGLCFMVAGSMACGIVGDDLLARVGDGYEAALARPHARVMDFTGRPLKGFVIVAAAGVRTTPALARWVREGVAFATSPEQIEKQRKAAQRPKRKRAFPKSAGRFR
ncbi:MAG: TfoX/Sxy family protein [Polyangiaceae bacterium]